MREKGERVHRLIAITGLARYVKGMSYILSCLLFGFATSALNAHLPNGAIVPPAEYQVPLPEGLSFRGDVGVVVYQPLWFAQLFPSSGACSRALTRNQVRVHASGGNLLSVSVNGNVSWLLASGLATYVPVHYRGGAVVHPYFVVRTPDWVRFHVEIRHVRGRKLLIVSLVRGRPGQEHLVPVFSAPGA